MSMNYGDDYFEPSEFDMLVDVWKETLKQSVKKEYQDEMERLKKENAKLFDIKNNWAKKCRELEAEKDKYRCATINVEKEAKKARLHELLEPYSKPAWGVNYHYEYAREKCDKCDKNGYIHYKTPMGRDAKEECSCRKRRRIFEPAEAEITEISEFIKSYDPKKIKVYFEYEKDEGRSYEEDKYKTVQVYSGQDFKDINICYGMVFLDKEKCQEYCDWLNDKEGKA